MCHQLDQSGVYQDPCRDGVEDAVHDQRGLAVWIERRADAQTDCDCDWCRQSVSQGHQIWREALRFWPFHATQTGSKGESFERLMEYENDVECREFLSRYGERQTNEDAVKDDSCNLVSGCIQTAMCRSGLPNSRINTAVICAPYDSGSNVLPSLLELNALVSV